MISVDTPKIIRPYTLEERQIIEEMLAAKKSKSEIADHLKRPSASIRKEIRSKLINGIYCAKEAQKMMQAAALKRGYGLAKELTPSLIDSIKNDYKSGISFHEIKIKYQIGHRRLVKLWETLGISREKRDIISLYRRIEERIDALEELTKTILEIIEVK